MRKTSVPKYVLVNQRCANTRAFKVKKRTELKAVVEAVRTLSLGCAYMPGYEQINRIEHCLAELKRETSEKQWGR